MFGTVSADSISTTDRPNTALYNRDSNGTTESGGQASLQYQSLPLGTPPDEAEQVMFVVGEDEPANPQSVENENARTTPFKEILESYGPVAARSLSPRLPFVKINKPHIMEATVSEHSLQTPVEELGNLSLEPLQ